MALSWLLSAEPMHAALRPSQLPVLEQAHGLNFAVEESSHLAEVVAALKHACAAGNWD
jgi:hypothetical protein